MATLTKDQPRAYELEQHRNDLPIIADDIVYEGACCGFSSGLIRPLVAADLFAGFAKYQCNNDGGAASAKNVQLIDEGDVVLNVTGVTGVTDVDDVVYADDDNTFTKTSSSNSAIGKITRWITGTQCVVHFEAASRRSI